jgi:hypothetical protein
MAIYATCVTIYALGVILSQLSSDSPALVLIAGNGIKPMTFPLIVFQMCALL